MAESAESASYFLLAFLRDASGITRGPDDLRLAFCRRKEGHCRRQGELIEDWVFKERP